MSNWIGSVLLALLLQQANAETRVVEYLKLNVAAGRPVVVSDLLTKVFKAPEEQQVVTSLFSAFFKIPMAIVQFYTRNKTMPTLQQLSDQFAFTVPGEMDVMLRIMETDPRIPRFLERDSTTGEITKIDVAAVTSDPRFGPIRKLVIGGWEGKDAPPFAIHSFSGKAFTSAELSGRPYLIYFWFTNCPPCVQTTPLLVQLYNKYKSQGFRIIAANADHVLELPYSDADRARYVKKAAISFAVGHATSEMQQAYGDVTIFPTMFFVNRQGKIVKQLFSYQDETNLKAAIQSTLEP